MPQVLPRQSKREKLTKERIENAREAVRKALRDESKVGGDPTDREDIEKHEKKHGQWCDDVKSAADYFADHARIHWRIFVKVANTEIDLVKSRDDATDDG